MLIIIKNLKRVLVIALIPLLFAASCNKSNDTRPCVGNAYSFAITSAWTPQRTIYNIGDTLFLSSSFSKSQTDLIGNYTVDYSNAKNIGGNCIIYELDTIKHHVMDAVMKFDFLSISGTISTNIQDSTRIKNIFFQELSSSYNLRIGIICKSKGIYDLSITDFGSQGIIGKNCTNAAFTNILTNTNKNIDLFQYALNRPPASQFEIDRIYCFRVQ